MDKTFDLIPDQASADHATAAGNLSELIKLQTIWSVAADNRSDPKLSSNERISPAHTDSTSAEDSITATRLIFEQAIDLLASIYPAVFDSLKVHRIAGYSLLLEWQGSEPSTQPVLLMCHYDVVPVDSTTVDKWSHPPFSGDVADGYIWGRGAIDNKSTVIATLQAIDYLLSLNFKPTRTLYLAISHDEEVGSLVGGTGIRDYFRKNNIQLAYTVNEGLAVTDGIIKGVDRPVALIGVAERGYFSVKLTASAGGGHSSVNNSDSAIDRIVTALDRVAKKQMPLRLEPPTTDMLAAIADEMSALSRFVLKRPGIFGHVIKKQLANGGATRSLVQTSLTTTMLSAGEKENVIPTTASAVINARPIPGNSIQYCLDHLTRLCDGLDLQLDLLPLKTEPSSISETTNEPYNLIEKSINTIFPTAVVAPGLVIAATETKLYSTISDNNYRFQPIVFDNTDAQRIHGIDERLSVSGLTDMVNFYALLIYNC